MKKFYLGFAVIVFSTLFILAIIFRENPTVLVILVIAALIFILNAYFYMRYIENKNKRIKRMIKKVHEKNDLLLRKQTIEEKIATDLPIGLVMLNEAYDIQWANETAKAIFQNTLLGRNLDMIHKALKDVLHHEDTRDIFTMKIYEQHYDITYDKDQMTLYLARVTEREEIKKKHAELTDVIGIIHLDNLDDAIGVLDVQEKNEILGRMLGAIDDWADDYGFYTVPISSSKIMTFMHKKNLDALVESNFKIIDKIADISKEHELMVTMSGGFACANIPLNQLGDIAEDALDLSLTRGGDQVVINVQGEPLKYFGGNTNTQEKRTRISSRINAQKLAALIEESDVVYIMPHKHPDTDALGASIGVLKIAQALKKKTYIILNFNALDKTVKKILQLMEYEYVSFLENFLSYEDAVSEASRKDLLILVDHHSLGQVIEEKLLRKIPNHVIIDHHRKLSDFITDARLSYIEPYASSSTELVVEMMHVFEKNITLNPFEATIMLSGIIVDTNNFMYRTGSRTFEAAALLRKYGADTYKVKNILRESLKDIQVKSQLLTRTELIKKRFSIVVVPDDIESTRNLLAQVADDLLEIDNTVAAFALGKLSQNTVGISARSLEGFNVQIVMEKFGGGGHLNNAGAQIDTDSIDQVKQELVAYLENAVQEEKPMKVILKKDLKNKGKKGEVIEVAPGYGNYLLTSKQAIEATPDNMQILEDEAQKLKAQEQEELEAMKALKQRIDYRAVKLYVKIGENGKFYGKINTKQIAEAFKEQHGIDIDKRKIMLDETIAALGTYPIQIKLHKDINATFELLVLEA